MKKLLLASLAILAITGAHAAERDPLIGHDTPVVFHCPETLSCAPGVSECYPENTQTGTAFWFKGQPVIQGTILAGEYFFDRVVATEGDTYCQYNHRSMYPANKQDVHTIQLHATVGAILKPHAGKYRVLGQGTPSEKTEWRVEGATQVCDAETWYCPMSF
jgi:hypothetical protein